MEAMEVRLTMHAEVVDGEAQDAGLVQLAVGGRDDVLGELTHE